MLFVMPSESHICCDIELHVFFQLLSHIQLLQYSHMNLFCIVSQYHKKFVVILFRKYVCEYMSKNSNNAQYSLKKST